MLDSSSKLPFHVLLLTQKGNLREPENTKNCGSEEKLKNVAPLFTPGRPLSVCVTILLDPKLWEYSMLVVC